MLWQVGLIALLVDVFYRITVPIDQLFQAARGEESSPHSSNDTFITIFGPKSSSDEIKSQFPNSIILDANGVAKLLDVLKLPNIETARLWLESLSKTQEKEETTTNSDSESDSDLPEVKPEAKSEVKSEVKPEVKPEIKPEDNSDLVPDSGERREGRNPLEPFEKVKANLTTTSSTVKPTSKPTPHFFGAPRSHDTQVLNKGANHTHTNHQHDATLSFSEGFFRGKEEGPQGGKLTK